MRDTMRCHNKRKVVERSGEELAAVVALDALDEDHELCEDVGMKTMGGIGSIGFLLQG